MDHTTEETASTRAAWGEGRIAFAAHANQIHQFIASGWPLKKIYRELEPALNGLSYQQFAYHIRRQKPKLKTEYDLPNKQDRLESPLPAGQTPGERGPHEKPKAPGQSTRFKPGPRIPDTSKLY
jgi:hypothetical protein